MSREADRMHQMTRAAEEKAKNPPSFETKYETEHKLLIRDCAAKGRYELVVFFDNPADVATAKAGFEKKGYTAKADVRECGDPHDKCRVRYLVVSWKL